MSLSQNIVRFWGTGFKVSRCAAGFRKGKGTRDQIANIHWIIEKTRELKNKQTNNFCFTDYAKAFDCVDHNKLLKILKEMGIPDHLTCLLRSLYAGQEATVRTGHETMDRFKVEKEVCLGCVLSPYLFNLYAVCCAVLSRSVVFNSLQLHGEYIMWNAGLDESQDGIKISGKNINLRYADDTSLMAESQEELKSLWRRWKRRVKNWLETQHSKI